MPVAMSDEMQISAPSTDARLYVTAPEGWRARIKDGWERHYCFYKRPGEDYFHLLMSGEIYLEHGEEMVCLMCALRRGVITTNRLYWQQRANAPRPL